jgi:hypothetical protein
VETEESEMKMTRCIPERNNQRAAGLAALAEPAAMHAASPGDIQGAGCMAIMEVAKIGSPFVGVSGSRRHDARRQHGG